MGVTRDLSGGCLDVEPREEHQVMSVSSIHDGRQRLTTNVSSIASCIAIFVNIIHGAHLTASDI
ncbi:hypothetical protein E2C01_071695 [Portunus trituberculatus]|uniref:Uncharacterized protein n=1 Tax=Portunus trituberculatus TaxID=210409 RepID=A0A5B7I5L6_PORTR|nr:hypothetical protein [Portunus trituberculatus]